MNEALLARIWRAQRFDRTNLCTTTGQPIQVVYPGRMQGGPGPDFREALIEIGTSTLVQGDVELHLRASDWCTHGHHRDAAYRDVILHVVLDADVSTETDLGTPIPVLALRQRLGSAADLVDLATIPDISCHEAAQRADDDAVAALLDQLGDVRLRDKAARFEGDLTASAADQLLYTTLLDGLGYSRNRAPFRALAAHVPIDLLIALTGQVSAPERFERLLAVLLGGAGLLPSQREVTRELDWTTEAHVEAIEAAWALYGRGLADDALDTHAWQFAGVRPLNSPTRRVVAAANLLTRLLDQDPVETVLDAVRRGSEEPDELASAFIVADPEGYWATHFDFDRPLTKPVASLIGAERARDLALNVALPFTLAWANRNDDRSLASAALTAYHRLPRSGENAITQRVLREVFGTSRSRLIRTARRQQALLHLDRRYCHWTGRCDCPVVRLLGQADQPMTEATTLHLARRRHAEDCVRVIVHHGDRLAVVDDADRGQEARWLFPGARIGDDETLGEAGRRAAREQLGIDIAVERVVFVRQHRADACEYFLLAHPTDVIPMGHSTDQPPRPALWVRPNDLPTLPMHPETLRFRLAYTWPRLPAEPRYLGRCP